jgi:hypothetical protein
MNAAQAQIDASHHSFVSAGFLNYVNDATPETVGTIDPTALKHSPMITMDAYHLHTIASATLASGLPNDLIVAPASSFIIKEYSDNTVRAFYNDVEYTPLGCQDGASCTTAEFKAAIVAKASSYLTYARCKV